MGDSHDHGVIHTAANDQHWCQHNGELTDFKSERTSRILFNYTREYAALFSPARFYKSEIKVACFVEILCAIACAIHANQKRNHTRRG